jgi:probable HAF family extracellular repeat protein
MNANQILSLAPGQKPVQRTALPFIPTLGAVACAVFLSLTQATPAAATTYTVTEAEVINRVGALDNLAAINANGDIVGAGNSHAFLIKNGRTTDLGTLPPPPNQSFNISIASGVNNAGQVVGHSWDASSNRRPVLWQNGTIQDLGMFNEPYIYNDVEATGINTQGQIVGFASGFLNPDRAWLYDRGVTTTLAPLDGRNARANAISEHGQIVGSSTALSNYHATEWFAGRATDLGALPGHRYSEADAINSNGTIAVGFSASSSWDDRHAVMFRNGAVIALDPNQGPYQNSYAEGVNNAGQVVGYNNAGPMLWQNGAATNLNTLVPKNIYLKGAFAINDKGQIVAVGIDRTKNDSLRRANRIFILTPQ